MKRKCYICGKPMRKARHNSNLINAHTKCVKISANTNDDVLTLLEKIGGTRIGDAVVFYPTGEASSIFQQYYEKSGREYARVVAAEREKYAPALPGVRFPIRTWNGASNIPE